MACSMSTFHWRDFGRLKLGSSAPVEHVTVTVHCGVAVAIGNTGPARLQFRGTFVRVCAKCLLTSVPLRSITSALPGPKSVAPNGVERVTAVMEGKLDKRLTPLRKTVLPVPRMSQAIPKRGEKSVFSGLYNLSCGKPGPTCTTPPGTVGSKVPRKLLSSCGGPWYS